MVGTNFNYREATIGNEKIENWLLTQLKPRIDFKFVEVQTHGVKVVVLEVLEIPAVRTQPTSFKNNEFIRVGTYNKKLKNFPEKERKLWRMFEVRPFEVQVALENVDSAEVTQLLDTGTLE